VRRCNVVELENLANGEMLQIGSRRRAPRQLRIYDKAAESSGTTPGIRWELEFKQSAAPRVVLSLLAENWNALMASELASFVDFRERSKARNVTRAIRSDWYERILNEIRHRSET
jgi:hypothetical protein